MEDSEKKEIVELVRGALREAVEPIEQRVEAHHGRIGALEKRADSHDADIVEVNANLVKCSSAAASAADEAYKAQRRANEAADETKKIVESALRIHNASIATSVEQSLRGAMQPFAEKAAAQHESLSSFRTATEEHLVRQDEHLKRQDGRLGKQDDEIALIKKDTAQILPAVKQIADSVATPIVRRALVVLLFVGGFVGAAYGGYVKATADLHSTPAPSKSAPQPIPSLPDAGDDAAP